jgi:GNAT superfamily N-acetyltransferase
MPLHGPAAAGVTTRIRPARHDDGQRLGVIETVAAQPFRDVGYPNVADDEPFGAEELAEYADGGRSWVAIGDGDADEPIGYVLVDVVDGNAHVEQVTVHPDHQGKGVGRDLMDRVSTWAGATGAPAVTLTTYPDVPWNRPLYEHLGFVVMTEDEVGPELRALRAVEATHGLDPAVRVCMRLDVTR